MPAEEVAQELALAKSRGHVVEAGLHEADLAGVVDRQHHVELAGADEAEGRAHALERVGDGASRQVHGHTADE